MNLLVFALIFGGGVARRLGFEDHQCPDHRQTCPDDSSCCPSTGGDFCCKNTTVPSSTCCGEGCCSDFEECCKDDQGEACCIQQTTFCVPKQSQEKYPARCCPRWTVGCGVGSVGCCDPAQPWQWNLAAQPSGDRYVPTYKSQPFELELAPAQQPQSAVSSPSTVYALFITGASGLMSMQIDRTSGQITNKVKVQLDDNPYAETTREFLFDENRAVFYYLDANFTANGGVRPSGGRPIYLYTIDAATGKSSKLTVSGAVDFPVGQAMCGKTILMATEDYSSGSFQGYNWFKLDPVSGSAVNVGHLARGADESADAFYSGFHRDCSPDGSVVYRFGYKYVSSQDEQGLSTTTINGGQTATKWQDELTPDHDYYMTMDRYDINSSSFAFVSLAPYKNDPKRGLDVMQWTPDGSAPVLVARLGNAHPPSMPMLGDLGYLGSYISGSTYLAMVVVDAPVEPEWGLAVVNLTNRSGVVVPLLPRTIAGTWGVSGVGMI